MSADAKAAFDLTKESPKIRTRYGPRTIGQSTLLARRLVEAGVPFVTVNYPGWDTHADAYTRLKEGYTGAKEPVGLIPSLDLALSALLDDLTDRGRLEETLVVVMGEFGRTPKVSTAGGRDHWPRVFCVLLAGGGVSGGQVIGSSDATGESPKDRPVTPADLAATIYTLLGIDPLSTLTTSDGRPVQISRDGKPLPEVVGQLGCGAGVPPARAAETAAPPASFNNRSGSRSMEQMARISTGSLIKLCHRVGTAVRSGIDARRVWEMEERHASGSLKSALGVVKSRVSEGGMIAEAMHSQNGYFPPMFVQMVDVGEQTGKLDEVLLRLAEHYEHQTSMKRIFWFGIAWPLLQLVAAILVIGLVIYITGIIADTRGGEALDLLGWGLTGTSGAIIWFLGCGFIP